MRILATQYTLNNKAFEIYTSGCIGNPHCKGCYSPETWSFDQGEYFTEEYFKQKIESKLKDFDTIIKNIMIFGGEPLDNSKEDLYFLLEKLSKFNKPIWIFTHYDIDYAKERLGESIKFVDYLKCGSYIPELTVENNIQYGIKLATSNQKIYMLRIGDMDDRQ